MLSLLEKMEADVTAGSQSDAGPNAQVSTTDSSQTPAAATTKPAGQGKADVLRRLAEDEEPAVQQDPAGSVPKETSPAGGSEKSLLTQPTKGQESESLTDPRKGTQGINESGVIWAPTGGGSGAAIGAAPAPPSGRKNRLRQTKRMMMAMQARQILLFVLLASSPATSTAIAGLILRIWR